MLQTTLQPSNTELSQNDNYTQTSMISITYTDGIPNPQLPYEVIIYNKTKQQYISSNLNSSHTEYGTMLTQTTFQIVTPFSISTTQLNVGFVARSITGGHTWQKTDEYHVYILQEDNMIDFDVQF